MQLVTKDTALEDFRKTEDFFIKDPKTGNICKMRCTKVGRAYYLHSYTMHRGAIGKYVCWPKRKGGVVVASLGTLLACVQSRKFRIT